MRGRGWSRRRSLRGGRSQSSDRSLRGGRSLRGRHPSRSRDPVGSDVLLVWTACERTDHQKKKNDASADEADLPPVVLIDDSGSPGPWLRGPELFVLDGAQVNDLRQRHHRAPGRGLIHDGPVPVEHLEPALPGCVVGSKGVKARRLQSVLSQLEVDAHHIRHRAGRRCRRWAGPEQGQPPRVSWVELSSWGTGQRLL